MSDHDDLAVAIIGMACRVPGAADPQGFWRNLTAGRCNIRRFDAQEMRAAGVPESLIVKTNYVPVHGYLEDYDQFDAQFFRIAPREAELIDPQHRVLMECTSEALQDAGLENPERREGQLVGVFAGVTISTYFAENVLPRHDLRAIMGDQQLMLACDKDYAALRLAHAFDLCGPTIAVQAACASSLAAVSMAVRSLLSGECDVALAGGASVRAPQIAGYLHVEGGTGSANGQCRAFDARADGSVPGSGAGVVVLKRLADARADGSQIHAIVRGAAITNDGANKPNLMMPTVEGQARAMASALAFAQLHPDAVRVFEAHGTGTRIGDPIEATAFARTYARKKVDVPAFLGTVKPNIGHLDAAAGIIGLIRVVMSLKTRQVPPVHGFDIPNPDCRFDETHFVVPKKLESIDGDPSAPVFGAVNSIGMGGVNVHVILQSPPVREGSRERARPVLLPVSAGTEATLGAAVSRLGDALSDTPSLSDAAFTLARGRAARRFRAVGCGRDAAAVATQLKRARARDSAAEAGAVVFLFPGQAQVNWQDFACAARELPEIAIEAREVLAAASELVGEDMLWLAGQGEAPEAPSEYQRQLAVFAGPLAVARALIRAGLIPDIVAGNSMGEISAAVIANRMPVETALKLLKVRSEAFEDAPLGAMVVTATVSEGTLPQEVWPAIVQGTGRTVYGGRLEAVDAFIEVLASSGKPFVRLPVSRAHHTPLMVAAARQIESALGDGAMIHGDGADFVGAFGRDGAGFPAPGTTAYWARQVASPARLDLALGEIARRGPGLVVDLDPRQALRGLLRVAPVGRAHMIPPGGDVAVQYLHYLGQAWCSGRPIAWPVAEDARMTSVPACPFDHRRYWLQAVVPDKKNETMQSAGSTSRPQLLSGINAHVTIYADRVEIRTGPAASASETAEAPQPAQNQLNVAPPTAPQGRAQKPADKDLSADGNETVLRHVVATFLGADDMGLDDNLLDLGANSLIIIQMIGQIRERLGIRIELADVFAAPTIAGLLKLLNGAAATTSAVTDGPAAPQPVDFESIRSELDEIERMSPDEVSSALKALEHGD